MLRGILETSQRGEAPSRPGGTVSLRYLSCPRGGGGGRTGQDRQDSMCAQEKKNKMVDIVGWGRGAKLHRYSTAGCAQRGYNNSIATMNITSPLYVFFPPRARRRLVFFSQPRGVASPFLVEGGGEVQVGWNWLGSPESSRYCRFSCIPLEFRVGTVKYVCILLIAIGFCVRGISCGGGKEASSGSKKVWIWEVQKHTCPLENSCIVCTPEDYITSKDSSDPKDGNVGYIIKPTHRIPRKQETKIDGVQTGRVHAPGSQPFPVPCSVS